MPIEVQAGHVRTAEVEKEMRGKIESALIRLMLAIPKTEYMAPKMALAYDYAQDVLRKIGVEI